MNRTTMLALLAGTAIGATAGTIAASRAGETQSPGGTEGRHPGSKTVLLSIDPLVADIEQKHGGRVTEIELERRPWGDHYEIELTDAKFGEWDIVVNARTGEILRESRDFD